MDPICLYTAFDQNSRPRIAGIKSGDKYITKHLFRPGEGKLLAEIYGHIDEITKLFGVAADRQIPIITSDFKAHLHTYNIPLTTQRHEVYDTHLPDVKFNGDRESDERLLKQILDKLATQKLKPYQKVLGNAAVVYEDLERTGLIVNHCLAKPKYSQKTFSGRSKTSGFNIQGMTEEATVWAAQSSPEEVLLYFDWVCADIRAAAILSGDEKLSQTFVNSDPYTAMTEEINADSTGKITRSESKLFLLKSINSMDLESIALAKIYPGLGEWVRKCDAEMHSGAHLETLLHRKFRLATAKNKLAVLNGVMQGSVAHAMQLVVRNIWEQIGPRLITEIHDSLVVSCSADSRRIQQTIDLVSSIMLRPFAGLLCDNPVFPLNVSIGKQWRRWQPYLSFRESGAHRVKTE
jgi:hypothetical protein